MSRDRARTRKERGLVPAAQSTSRAKERSHRQLDCLVHSVDYLDDQPIRGGESVVTSRRTRWPRGSSPRISTLGPARLAVSCTVRKLLLVAPSMAEPDDAVILQTLSAHIQTAVRRDGVPIATLKEMLAQLPTTFRGRFAAARETIAFFMRSCVSKPLLKPTEALYDVLSVGDKVCFVAQLNHNKLPNHCHISYLVCSFCSIFIAIRTLLYMKCSVLVTKCALMCS